MIAKYIKAGFPLLAIRSFEPDLLRKQIVDEVSEIRLKEDEESEEEKEIIVYDWDCVSGISCLSHTVNKKLGCERILDLMDFIPKSESDSVFLLHNFHRFFKNTEVLQRLQNFVTEFKDSHHTLVIVSPVIDLPIELERFVTILDHNLPTKPELIQVVNDYLEQYEKTIDVGGIDETRVDRIAECGLGQTGFEFENGLTLTIINEKTINPETIWDLKCQIVRKNGNIDLGHFDETLEDLIGLENMKEFGRMIMGSPLARGMLMLGVPGTGKSHYAKALGRELGLPTLCLDFGRMFGRHVGESEERMRGMLSVVEAMSPAMLFIDEIEKGMAGSQSSGVTDSGVTARVLGTFLSWMNDHKCQTPIIATCNNIDRLPDEFLRAERWDAIFFIDLPTENERKGILDHYLKVYKLGNSFDDVWKRFDFEHWTGAEIRTFCRLASIMKTKKPESDYLGWTHPYVIPIYKSREKNIKHLQRMSKNIAVAAGFEEEDVKKKKKVYKPSTRKIHATKEKQEQKSGSVEESETPPPDSSIVN